jgi:DNA-binding transcriptional ArsR family regulator
MTRAYEEVIEFIAAGSDPRRVADFQPSKVARARVQDLLKREKRGEITNEERSELDHYAQLEHIMRLAKTQVRQHLKAS